VSSLPRRHLERFSIILLSSRAAFERVDSSSPKPCGSSGSSGSSIRSGGSASDYNGNNVRNDNNVNNEIERERREDFERKQKRIAAAGVPSET